MADLEFSKSVPGVQAGQTLPAPYHRQAQVEVTPFPDFQSAMSSYAANTNWMSFIGSAVASAASTAIAQKVGGELGKNPQGNIGIPLTDFDKTMQQSYNTQAQATLGLQANKLITDSNIEAAKASRITPDLLQKTNDNITKGLQNILKNAPDAIKPSMENQFGNAVLDQHASLSSRMIREQKEDQKNNNALASDMNSQHAYSFGVNGNDKAGLAAIENTTRLNQASVASRLITPEDAKSNIDSARKSYLSGKMIHDYEQARAQGKGEDFLKSVAEKSDKSNPDYMAVTNNLMQYVNHQDAMRSQDQQLRLAKFQTSVAMNPMAPDMASQLQDLKNNVSPDTYEKAQLGYINAVKTFNKENGDVNNALASWNDPSSFARLTEKSINKGFDMMVNRYVQQREQDGNPISHEEAEVQVAASAGGKVPVFVNSLKNKINSGNAAMMDIAGKQMDVLYAMNKSHALAGLSDSDKSIYTQFKSLRDALPPEEAAKIAIQNANQDPDTQKMNKEKWSAFVKSQTAGGIWGATAPTKWALKQVGMDEKDFINPGIANEYGNLVLQKYATFYQNLNGDKDNALKLTKQEANENFGMTGVNGGSVKTLHPLEKVLGYEENSDVVPFIQQDVIGTLNKSFVPMKEAFAKNEANEYWDVVPSEHKNKNILFGHNYPPIQVKRYTKSAKGVKTDTYDVMLIGNSFNWDIALKTDSGMRPLIQVAPYLGIQTYTPNKKSIDDAYMKHVRSK